jgi:hypothetical protein
MRPAAAALALTLTILLPAPGAGALPPPELELGAGDELGERLFPERQRRRALGLPPAAPPRPARCEQQGREQLACLRLLLRSRRAAADQVEEDVLAERRGAQRLD